MRNADAWRQCSLLFLPFHAVCCYCLSNLMWKYIFGPKFYTYIQYVEHRCAPSYDEQYFFFWFDRFGRAYYGCIMHTRIHSKTHAYTRTHNTTANTRRQYCQKQKTKITKTVTAKLNRTKGRPDVDTQHISDSNFVLVWHFYTYTNHRLGIQKFV